MKNLVPKRRFEEFKDAHAWEQRELGEITESFSGGTPSVGNSQYYGGTIPFIRSGEIASDKTELFVTEVALNNSSARMVKIGDVLYALYGATSGEVSISRINGAINQAILAIRSTRNDDHYFIGQWLRMQKEQIISTYLQGGQGNLSGSIVKKLMIALPVDKGEQKLISSFLSNLDNLITLHQRKLDKLRDTKSAYLAEIFPKEGEVYPKRRFPGFTEPWEERKLGEMANYRRGSFPQPYGNKEWYDGEGAMPFVQVVDVTSNLKLVDDTKQKISKIAQPKSVYVPKGKVVVTLQGSVGRVAITQYDSYLDRTLLIFESYNQVMDDIFWAYLIQMKFDIEKEKAPGATIKTITIEALSNFEVTLPKYEEQTLIGNFFKQLDSLITLQESKLTKLQALKKAYLSEMFV